VGVLGCRRHSCRKGGGTAADFLGNPGPSRQPNISALLNNWSLGRFVLVSTEWAKVPGLEATDRLQDVFHDEIRGRDQIKGDEGGENDAEAERDRHWDQKLRLQRAIEHQR